MSSVRAPSRHRGLPSAREGRYVVTRHAPRRMSQRGIPLSKIEAALTFGGKVERAGSVFVFVGRREVENAAAVGIDLSNVDRICVICSPDGAIKTAYRDRDLAILKRRRPHRHKRHR